MIEAPGASLRDFADVVAWLEARGLAFMLAEDGRALTLQRDRATVGLVSPDGTTPAEFDVLMVVGAGDQLAAALEKLASSRVQVFPLPCSSTAFAAALAAAQAAADAFVRAQATDRLLEVGAALNREREPDRVLELILQHARALTVADAGSIYLVEDDGAHLRFKCAQNDSVAVDFSEFTIPVTDHSIVGACVRTGQVVNIPDLYAQNAPSVTGKEFVHDRSFDTRFGYETRSIITAPMRPPGGRVLGVIQLINAKRRPGRVAAGGFREVVVPFSAADERLCLALAAQGAVALENARLYDEIQALFEGFVRASVHAIEQRDPTTSGHSQRVADLTVALAMVVDRSDDPRFASVRFGREELRELEYAGLLHDFGKVAVREQVLVKAKKLYGPQLELVMARFEHMRTVLQLQWFERRLERARAGMSDDGDLAIEHERRLQEIDEMMQVVLDANEPTVVQADEVARLREIAAVEFRDARNRRVRLLEDAEVTALLLRRGSLTEAERVEIQSHVTHTYNFLVRIPWSRGLKRVPEIAGKHHEYLDGTGYPHRMTHDEIPVQTRMMTVSDIFDALTASDRPYKKAVPLSRALDILRFEVEAGKLDASLLDLFIEARVFETIGLHL